MEVGIRHSLLTQLDGGSEIVFNDLSGTTHPKSLSGIVDAAHCWPNDLPDGNGYLMQWISGMHGAPARAPVDVRPHKHGGIVHKFFLSAKYFTLTGLVVATDPEMRTLLNDTLTGWIHNTLQNDARYFFKPAGADTRFITVRNFATADILGPAGSPGASPSGIAAPKQYDTQFVAANPFSYRYTEDSPGTGGLTTIALGDTQDQPNIGTVETWPVLRVHGPISAFTVDNGESQLEWFSAVEIPVGHFIEINMYNETMYKDGNSTNELGGFLDAPSDFWAIPPGGAPITFVGTSSHTGGDPTCDVLSNSAWV